MWAETFIILYGFAKFDLTRYFRIVIVYMFLLAADRSKRFSHFLLNDSIRSFFVSLYQIAVNLKLKPIEL